MISQDPVGVFDSGVGGLSVLRQVRKELPGEDLIYVADSAHAPYGERSRAFIEERSIAVAEFLIARRAKAIVVACNTATGLAVETLRSHVPLPIVGMEPALKPAASTTRSGVIGVLATTQTLSSSKFSRLLAEYGATIEVLLQACPGLVEQVEDADLSGDATRVLVEKYVRPMLDKGADTLVLGCTHYPFLGDLIQEVAGADVSVIDPAVSVARELRRRLQAETRLSRRTDGGSETFWTSGPADRAQRVIAELWGSPVVVGSMSREFCEVAADR